MKRLMILSVLIVLVLCLSLPAEDTDILPLGKSKYRYEMGKIELGRIVETATNKTLNIKDIVKSTSKTDLYVIGETHVSYDCHKFQKDFIEELFKNNPKIIIGFEFFKRSDNEVLEKWRTGLISEDELLKSTGWFKKQSYHYNYTKMIMDLIQKHHIRVIGLNISRKTLRRVSRKGFDTLSAEEKKMFPTINVFNRDHQFFVKRVFGEFASQVPAWFTRMYASQKIWDVVMAESMLAELRKNKGYKGVIIAGNFHVIYKLGIPFRYNLSHKRARITSIVPVYLPVKDESNESGEVNPMIKMLKGSLKPAAVFSRGIGDYVFSIKKSGDDYFKKTGVKGEMKEGDFIVKSIAKGSYAEKNGLKKGDIIKSIIGKEIKSIEDFEFLMYKNFGKNDLKFELIRILKQKTEVKKSERKK
jgi:uncharacterized iron-regulated protein